MKLILRGDVSALGKEGDVIEVARGYARNYLLPKGLAVEASTSNLKQLELKKKALEKKEAEKKVQAEGLAKKLEGKKASIIAKAGAAGKLYGSVTSKDIAEAIYEQLKVEVDRKKIVLEEGLKNLGTFPVSVRLHPGVEVSVEVEVKASEEKAEEIEEKDKKKEEDTEE